LEINVTIIAATIVAAIIVTLISNIVSIFYSRYIILDIVRFFGVFTEIDGRKFIVTELCKQDLASLLRSEERAQVTYLEKICM
jgi:hypothetical protein